MLRVLTTTIFLSIFLITNSQEIVNPSKLWSSMEEHCQPWGSTYSTDYLRFESDTIIDDYTYKHVWISEDEDHEEWNFYGAFIREENNRVYYRQMFGEEGLIYDFNLELGDSVLIDNPRAVGAIWLFLAEVDSVETVEGMKERWRLISNEYPNSEYWIRGVGSRTGVLNSSSGIFGGLCGLYTLLCQKEDGELIYVNPEYQSCYLYTTGRDEGEKINDPIRLKYDKFQKSVTVIFSGNSEKEIILSNITGHTKSSISNSLESTTLSLLNNPAGIYIITVLQDGNRYSKKFILH